MHRLQPGDILRARVQRVCAKGVSCDIGEGCTAWMPISRLRIARLRHGSEVYTPGDILCAAVWSVSQETGQVLLTGRETLGTWLENAQHFRQGRTVTGTARTILPYGIFVELAPNLCGLAEPRPGIAPGDALQVSIRAILPEKHKVKLDIVKVSPQPPPMKKPEYYITSGHISRWEYWPGSDSITVF